jgi:transcriptional activator of cad operon
MDRPSDAPFRIGDWYVNPMSGQLSRNGEVVRLEARTMRLLLSLAERPGELVSIEELLKEVWPGVIVTSDSVYQAVASLRRVLGDDPKRPTYIATVPRLGYRMVAPVSVPANHPAGVADRGVAFLGDAPVSGFVDAIPVRRRPIVRIMIGATVTLCLVLVATYVVRGRYPAAEHSAGPPDAGAIPRSIAVVPFLDLTAGMSHEYLADGLTEELIDKLSAVPDLRVAPPTTSFYLKGKQLAVTDIAKALRVAYVLDGSVRKSGTTVRVAARLIRGDSGFVVWSETYDRPSANFLVVQNDIAAAVTKALTASIDSGERLSQGRAHQGFQFSN